MTGKLPKKISIELRSGHEKTLIRWNRREEMGRHRDQNMWRDHHAVKN